MALKEISNSLDNLKGTETLTVQILTGYTGNVGEKQTKELYIKDQNGNIIYHAEKI